MLPPVRANEQEKCAGRLQCGSVPGDRNLRSAVRAPLSQGARGSACQINKLLQRSAQEDCSAVRFAGGRPKHPRRSPGDQNIRSAVRVPLPHWAHGSACHRLGSHNCLAQCALPLGDRNILNAVRATETSAMQSGYPPPSSKRAEARTECSHSGHALSEKTRMPGLRCGGLGRPDCIADVSVVRLRTELCRSLPGRFLSA